MTREQFLKLIDKFDWNAGYPWKHELSYLRNHDQAQREEIARLREALTEAVDIISYQLPGYTVWLEQAQAALAKEATRDKAE